MTLAALSADPVPPNGPASDRAVGEPCAIDTRVVVAPAAGRFRPRVPRCPGGGLLVVEAGEHLGVIEGPGATVTVPSPFHGRLLAVVAWPGERMRAGQVVAWLQVESIADR